MCVWGKWPNQEDNSKSSCTDTPVCNTEESVKPDTDSVRESPVTSATAVQFIR